MSFLRKLLQGILQPFVLTCIFLTAVSTALNFFGSRLFVYILAKTFRPDLDGFVTGLSATYSSWPEFNVIYCIFIDGAITTGKQRFSFQNNILNKKGPNGEDCYKKFKQTWTYFFLYKFWKEDTSFKLEHHVRDYDYKGSLEIQVGSTEDHLRGVASNLLHAPWPKGRSRWELFVVPLSEDSGKPRTVFIFRSHHALLDGYSFANFIQDLAGAEFNIARPKAFKTKRFGIQAYLRVPYELAGMLLEQCNNPTRWSLKKDGEKREYHTSVLKSIPVNLIKEAKRDLGVSYAAVLFAAAGGALQRIFAEAQLPVPHHLYTHLVTPRPNHPGGLENHMTICRLKWYIQSESTTARAHRIHKKFTQMSTSVTTRLMFIFPAIIGLNPAFLCRMWADYFVGSGSILATTFPVPENQCYWDGIPATSMYTGLGIPGDCVGANIVMTGINGSQGFILKLDKRVFPSEKIFHHFGEYVEQELMTLLQNP